VSLDPLNGKAWEAKGLTLRKLGSKENLAEAAIALKKAVQLADEQEDMSSSEEEDAKMSEQKQAETFGIKGNYFDRKQMLQAILSEVKSQLAQTQ